MAVDLVRRNVPCHGFGIKFNPENDSALPQDEGFIRVIDGSKRKADLSSQIHICCDNTYVGRQINTIVVTGPLLQGEIEYETILVVVLDKW